MLSEEVCRCPWIKKLGIRPVFSHLDKTKFGFPIRSEVMNELHFSADLSIINQLFNCKSTQTGLI